MALTMLLYFWRSGPISGYGAGKEYRVERMIYIENSDTREYHFCECVTPKQLVWSAVRTILGENLEGVC